MIDAQELLDGKELNLSPSIAKGIFAMVFGGVFCGVPLSIMASQDASLFLLIFILVGGIVFIRGFLSLFEKIRLTCHEGILNYCRHTLFNKSEWSEKLSNYVGLRHKKERRGGKQKTTYQLIILEHDDNDKSLTLFDERGHEMPRQEMETYSKALKLPLLYETAEGTVKRSHEDIDKKLVDDVQVNSAGEAQPSSGGSHYLDMEVSPSGSITYKRDRYSRADEIIYTITSPRVSWIVLAVLVGFFCFWMPGMFGHYAVAAIPLAAGAWVVFEDRRKNRQISLGNGTIRLSDEVTLFPNFLGKLQSVQNQVKSLKLSDIEEINIHNALASSTLHIIADRATINTGALSSMDDAKWLKAQLTEEIKLIARY